MEEIALLLKNQEEKICQGVLISKERQIPHNISILKLEFEDRVFDIFDKLIIRVFDEKRFTLEFSTTNISDGQNIKNLLQKLYNILPKDSNGLSYQQTPSKLNPFLTEFYVWYLDENHEIIIDNEADILYGVTFEIDTSFCQLGIINGERIMPQLFQIWPQLLQV